MLLDVMLVDRREEMKRRHMGNLVWYVARYLHPDAGIDSYASFADRLDADAYGRKGADNVGEVIEDMISHFLPKRGDHE